MIFRYLSPKKKCLYGKSPNLCYFLTVDKENQGPLAQNTHSGRTWLIAFHNATAYVIRIQEHTLFLCSNFSLTPCMIRWREVMAYGFKTI